MDAGGSRRGGGGTYHTTATVRAQWPLCSAGFHPAGSQERFFDTMFFTMNSLVLIVEKLRELQAQIPTLKQKRLTHITTTEFRIWHASLMKWLEAGKPWTTGEFEQVERQPYRSLELLGRSPEDEEAYQNELDMTSHHIGSAIAQMVPKWCQTCLISLT